MLRNNKILFIEHVPSAWIFEHYACLSTTLDGKSIKIFSIFRKEKTPSMVIYYCDINNEYRFKDFSSGHSGNGCELVKNLYDISYYDAIRKIINDYNAYIKSNGAYKILMDNYNPAIYKLSDYKIRPWNKLDVKYWTSFGIGSEILSTYNVKAIDGYTMSKVKDDIVIDSFNISRQNTYGYFTDTGEMYKVYYPMAIGRQKKFINLGKYLQGSDQLSGTNKYLLICSSLKDIMSFKAMGFKNIDCIAPNSENTNISEEKIAEYKLRYNTICTLLDNDTAGLKAMMKYQEKYGFPYIHLQMEKDIADSVKEYGLSNTRIVLYPLITKAFTGVAKYL